MRKMRIMLLGQTHTPCQNGLLMRREFEALGHSVVYILFPGTSCSVIQQAMITHSPDILFQTGGRRAGASHLEEAKRLGIKTVLWYADAYGLSTKGDEEYFNNLKDLIDVAFISVKGVAEELRSVLGMNTVWLPQYFDNVYFNTTLKRLSSDEEIFDCCFIGNHYDQKLGREQKLLELSKHFKLKVCGGGYKEIKAEFVTGADLANVYKSSKIAINFLYIHNPTELQMSNRIFSAMGCGSLFMTPHIHGIEQMFIPGKHLIEWKDIPDLIDKIEYFLKHDREREEIAIEGRKVVMREHTIGHRVKQYESYLQELIGDKLNYPLKVSNKNYV